MINGALANKPRFDAMRDFFEGVGTGFSAGVWQDTPQRRQGPKIEGPKKPIGEMA